MSDIYEFTPECSDAVQKFINELKEANKPYEPKHPNLKKVICEIGGASVGYLVDGILTSVAPTPVKFPIIGAKIMQKIGIIVLSAMAAKKAADFLGEEYNKDEQIILESKDKIKEVMNDAEGNAEDPVE